MRGWSTSYPKEKSGLHQGVSFLLLERERDAALAKGMRDCFQMSEELLGDVFFHTLSCF